MVMEILIILVSYCFGSIPTGFLFGKFLKNIDLRLIGSGSTGATNVLRNVGKWPAFYVFIIDVIKGLIAVKIAQYYVNENLYVILAGLTAIAGHIWPIWLKGKGGKAVATGLGIFLALSWKVGLASLGIFLMILIKSKFVSLSSITAATFLPILMFLNLRDINHPYVLLSIFVSILVIWKHRTNIKRLIRGEESKINAINK